MQDAATALALAERLDQQCGLLRAELERVRGVGRRVASDPTALRWSGPARSAFDAEVAVLRGAVSSLERQLTEAEAQSMRARETLLTHVG